MTWRGFHKTWMIATLGVVSLAAAPQARAEGNDGSGVISPEKAESFVKEAEEAAQAAETIAEPAKADDVQNKKASRLARAKQKSKAKEVIASVAPAEAAGQPEDERAQHTAAISVAVPDPSPKSPKADTLKPLIVRYASENGLPYELADAVVRLESRYNPGARSGGNLGLTQINLRTAQSLGYQGAASGLFDAETNLRYGLRYLAQAYRLAGGDTCGTILRYQFGHRTRTMTGASRAYCTKVKVITAVADEASAGRP